MSIFSELNMYMEDIEKIPILTPQEEYELALRVFQGDRYARDKLVASNLRFVLAVVPEFMNRGVSVPDLVSEGNLGLIRAADYFDPNEGVRFLTFAGFWVKQAMRRIIINQGSVVRLPNYLVRLMAKWAKVEKSLTLEYGRKPTWEEIRLHLSLAGKRETFLLHAKKLNRHVVFNTEDMTYSLAIDSSEEKLMEADDMAFIIQTMNRLEKRQADLIRMRYGLPPYTDVHTLREIGEKLDLSRERVRQIESETLNELASFFREDA